MLRHPVNPPTPPSPHLPAGPCPASKGTESQGCWDHGAKRVLQNCLLFPPMSETTSPQPHSEKPSRPCLVESATSWSEAGRGCLPTRSELWTEATNALSLPSAQARFQDRAALTAGWVTRASPPRVGLSADILREDIWRQRQRRGQFQQGVWCVDALRARWRRGWERRCR